MLHLSDKISIKSIGNELNVEYVQTKGETEQLLRAENKHLSLRVEELTR